LLTLGCKVSMHSLHVSHQLGEHKPTRSYSNVVCPFVSKSMIQSEPRNLNLILAVCLNFEETSGTGLQNYPKPLNQVKVIQIMQVAKSFGIKAALDCGECDMGVSMNGNVAESFIQVENGIQFSAINALFARGTRSVEHH